MFNEISPLFLAVVGGAFCLAMLAVAVSQKAQTSAVLQGGGSALATIINAAVSPVGGAGGSTFGSVGAGGTGSTAGSGVIGGPAYSP